MKRIDFTAILWPTALFLAIFSLALPLPPTIFVALLAAAFGFLILSAEDGERSVDRTMLLVLLAFVLFSVLSAVFAEGWQRALLKTLSMVPAGFVWYLIAKRLPSQLLILLPWTLAIMMGVIAIYLLIVAGMHPALSPQEWMDVAGYRHFSVPNDLLFLAVCSPFVMLLVIHSGRNALRIGAALSLLAGVVCLIVYQSRTALLILVVMVLVYLSRYRPRGLWITAGALLVVFVGVEWLTGFQMTAKLLALNKVTSRVPLWLAAWQMFLDAPVLGHGPGAFSLLYEEYFSSLSLSSWVMLDSRHMPWAHNIYLELMAERGLFGLLSFMIVVVLALRNNRLNSNDISGVPLRNGAIYSLLILLAAGLVDLSLLRLWVVVAIAIHVALLCDDVDDQPQ